MSGRAVEAAGDVTTLLLDKTGTITFGARQAAELLPVARRHRARSWPRPRWPRASPTRRRKGARSSSSPSADYGLAEPTARDAVLVPFTAQTRMSGMDFPTERAAARSSARAPPRACAGWSPTPAASCPLELGPLVDGVVPRRRHAARRHRPARRARRRRILGVIRLKDTVKPGMTRALRPAAGDGHPHRDDHRRQPAHGGGDRRARPASTTSSPRRRPRTRWR